MQTFRKNERLCRKKAIECLFESGKKIRLDPFTLIWNKNVNGDAHPLQVLITVSKKHVPLASRRNYLRRLIREAFRRNKHTFAEFLTGTGQTCELAIIYNGPEKPGYTEVNTKILLILQRLQRVYEKVPG
jgi:ribonuclease P protein component